MSNFVPLHQHSHYSLLDGVSKPKQIAKRCNELGYTAAGISDHGNVGVSVQFVTAMKAANIKPILGMETYLTSDPTIKDKDNHKLTHLPIFAKNLAGWKALIKSNSFGNHKEHFYHYPRINLETLSDFGGGNLIAISGHPGSDLANAVFINPSEAYDQTDYDNVKEYHVHKDWESRVLKEVGRYQEFFGKDNFFLEVQIIDPENSPAGLIAARAMRWVSRKHKIGRVATKDSHYPSKIDAPDQRVLLCSAMNMTLKEMYKRIDNGTQKYFKSNFMGAHYHIPSLEEVQAWNDEEEIANSQLIADMCEDYDIRHSPILPTYPTPDGMSADSYLTKLCREGWVTKINPKIDENQWGEYQDRVRKELKVIKEAGLSSYFLIVQDYCNWARSVGMIVGPGRGSGAGCLVSYLIGITAVDPIKYGLIFERFYNAGRNAPGHISLPDIDCDFPVVRKKEIIAYLKSKYGHDKVANIATFNSLKGRGALTAVLRAQDVPFDEVKRITNNIPKPDKITEELQAMKDRGEEPSIVKYALESDPDSYRDWCVLNDDGTYDGVFAGYFEQAIRLEGTKTNISTHAAGVVLSSTPLSEKCPLVYDSDIDGYIAGMEGPDLEEQGQVKFDILGVASIDKITGSINLLRHGYVEAGDVK